MCFGCVSPAVDMKRDEASLKYDAINPHQVLSHTSFCRCSSSGYSDEKAKTDNLAFITGDY